MRIQQTDGAVRTGKMLQAKELPGSFFSFGEQIRKRNPLIHCITSPIAVNDCANAVLAVGARPIMAEHPQEVAGITAISQALGVSLANITDARAESIMISGRQALQDGLLSVIDAVGVNCSAFRMDLAKRYIRDCRPAVIKGNASEIRAIAGAAYGEAGIDTAVSDCVSRDNPGSIEAAAEVVRNFAVKTGAVVLASGIIDVISDGTRVWIVENGSPLMARVTGTGCVLNCLIASYLSLCRKSPGQPADTAGSVTAESVTTESITTESAAAEVAKAEDAVREAGAAGGFVTVTDAVCYAAALMGIAGEMAERQVQQKGALGSYHIALIDALSLAGEKEIKDMEKVSML